MVTTAEELRRILMRSAVSVHFTAIQQFKREVETHLQELDKVFWQQMMDLERQWRALPATKNGLRIGLVTQEPQRSPHETFLCESLVLIMWHKVENLLKLAIARGGTTTKKQRDNMYLGDMRDYFGLAGKPLEGMPRHDEVRDMHDVCLCLKHYDGKATCELVKKGYAGREGEPIRVTRKKIDEWIDACNTFLHAAMDAAPIAPWKPPAAPEHD